MAKFQVCPTGLDPPCAPRLIPKPVLTLSHNTYQRPSAPPPSTGKAASGEVDERQEDGFSEIRAEGDSPRLPSLKRSRQDEDESSNSPMEMSPPSEDRHPFLHHHHPAVETPNNNNFPSVPHSQQQPSPPESNGHATLPIASEAQHFGSDPHLLPEPGQPGGLLYLQTSGAGSYLEVLAELERTKRKNIELQGRVIRLEAKLSKDEKHGCALSNGSKKSKKARKADKIPAEGDEEDGRKAGQSSQSTLPEIKQEEGLLLQNATPIESMQSSDRQDNAVNWMSREEVTPADLEKLNNMVSEKDDSGDSDDDDDDDDEEDDDEEEDDRDGKEEGRHGKKSKGEGTGAWKEIAPGEDGKGAGGLDIKVEGGGGFTMVACSGKQQEEDESDDDGNKKLRRKKSRDGKKGRRGEKTYSGKRGFGLELPTFRGPGIMSSYRKAPKTAFCPMEVKRIMGSGVLALKNAQSHTMRKIIVFASLGIRHGCEDLYELDFTHFSIEKRGEPHVSPKEPGEHVVYAYPGAKPKLFYPNRQNPILCPVKILEEERAMRPAGPSCPSCLFLCIKYGGRTRNLPQNEYVRQRMGRNKLKSFGPLMCQMAFLVHIRTGSFFFKALGITLLFMAGFSNDLVRKETKYRNLDLLQKYYRSDDDAKHDLLFHPYPPFFLQTPMAGPSVPHKNSLVGGKPVGKRGPPPLLSKPPGTHTVPRYLQPLSTRAPANSPFRGPPVAFPPALPPGSTVPPTSGTPGNPSPPGSHPPPPPFAMYPGYAPVQRAPGGFAPLPVWPPVNTYPHPPGAYPPPTPHPYAYSPYAHSSQYGPQPYYGPPFGYPPFGGHPLASKKEVKKEAEGSESDSDSDSSSSGAGQKSEEKGNSSDSKDAQ